MPAALRDPHRRSVLAGRARLPPTQRTGQARVAAPRAAPAKASALTARAGRRGLSCTRNGGDAAGSAPSGGHRREPARAPGAPLPARPPRPRRLLRPPAPSEGSDLRSAARPAASAPRPERSREASPSSSVGREPGKDMRSRGRTDGSSRRHSSSGQLLNSSSDAALPGAARPSDMPRPRAASSRPATAQTGSSRQALRALAGAGTIERGRAALPGRSSRA